MTISSYCLMDVLRRIHQILLKRLPSNIQNAYMHWRMHGKWPDPRSPQTFNEKLCWKKTHSRNNVLVETADKVQVRKYVAQKIGDQYLTKIYGAFSDAHEINFNKLPAEFVVKANHGSGWNYFVPDATALNRSRLVEECNSWLKMRYEKTGGEWWYGLIHPQLMVEEFLHGADKQSPQDFKFFVFRGVVAMVQVDTSRFTDHTRNLYSPEWERIDCGLRYPQGDNLPRPLKLEEMLEVSARLGADFDFVRVDLYEVGERIVFGELTHCPGSGWERFSDMKVDYWLGSLLKLR